MRATRQIPLLLLGGLLACLAWWTDGSPLLAASWARSYGGPADDGLDFGGDCLLAASDGDLVVAGYTRSFGGADADLWVLRLDPDGNVRWERTYPCAGDDLPRAVGETPDGGFVVAGGPDPFGGVGGEAWVRKLDGTGVVEWARSYAGAGADHFMSIGTTAPDGGYIAAGLTDSAGAGGFDAWVVKLDASGNVEWERTYGGPTDDGAWSVRQISAGGGYMVAGFVDGPGGASDAWILRLGATGDVVWERAYGTLAGDEWATTIEAVPAGGFVVAGNTSSFGAGDQDFWVLRLTGTGDVRWERCYGGGSADEAWSIQPLPDPGGFLVAGLTDSFVPDPGSFWALKLYPSGQVEWQKLYGGPGDEMGRSVRLTSDGGIALLGSTASFGGGGMDLWVLRTEPDGAISYPCGIVEDTLIAAVDTTASAVTTTALVSAVAPAVTDLPTMDVATAAGVEQQCPGARPPEPTNLRVSLSGQDLLLTFDLAPGATTHSGYRAALPLYYDPDWSWCHRDATDPAFTDNGDGTATYDCGPVPPGVVWYLVSSSTSVAESSLGWGSPGERDEPPSTWRCGAGP